MKIPKFLKIYMRSRSRSMLLKIFVSSVAVSLVIIAVLGIYIYSFLSHNLDMKIEKYEQKKVNETIQKMNILFDEMQKLTLSYQNNRGFTQFMFLPREDIISNFKETQNNIYVLTSIVSSINYIKGLFIFYEHSGYIIGNYGAMQDIFYPDREWKKAYDQMTGKSLVMDMRRIPIDSVSDGNIYNNAITLITGIPYNSGKKLGAVVLYLDPVILSDLLKGISDGGDNTLAFIVNSKGVVMSSTRDDYLCKNISEIIRIPSGAFVSDSGKFEFTMNDTKMIAYYDTSGINDWKLLHAMPENILFNESSTFKYATLIILMLLLSFTVIISLIFSFRVYNPIKAITVNIKNMFKLNEDRISDISIIQGGFDLLFENNRHLEDQVNQNKMQIKEMFISHLITGKFFNKNEIKSKAEYLQVDLESENFCVARHTKQLNLFRPVGLSGI